MSDYLDCGHDTSAGVAHTPQNERICYACASELERTAFAQADDFYAYVNSDNTKITTWPGATLARIARHTTSRGAYQSTIHHYHAIDSRGGWWYGKNGGPGLLIRIKRIK